MKTCFLFLQDADAWLVERVGLVGAAAAVRDVRGDHGVGVHPSSGCNFRLRHQKTRYINYRMVTRMGPSAEVRFSP